MSAGSVSRGSELAIDESPRHDDEIDLGELFAAIWAHKFLVASVAGLGLLAAAFYALSVATPTYEAQSRFELNEANRESFGELGGLATLAGVDIDRGGASEAEKLQDRIFSRPFLEQIAEPAALYEDPEFNGTLQPPGLKDQVIDALGLASDETQTQARIDAEVARRFEDLVALSVKENGILELTVMHPDPERAAAIANIVVSQALKNLYDIRREQTREKLDYFAAQLFEVRSELDQSAQALKDYSLANNLQSQEELARSSAQLVSLRERREDLSNRSDALHRLAELARGEGGFDIQSRDAFLRDHPTASSLEFRRLIGWSGAEESWSLPAPDQILALRESLDNQVSTLDRTIRELEEDAEQSAEAATELEALRREIAVNEAMYEAMLKQFEGESLTSGFAVESGQVIETAVPPVEPSAPRKALIAALGMVLGVFGGIGLALFFAMRRGVLHTKGALIDAFAMRQASTAHRAIARRSLRNFKRGMRALRGKPMRAVEDLLVQIGPDIPARIAVVPSAAGRLATNGALAIADLQRPSQGRLCIVDLSETGDLLRSLGLGIGGDPAELDGELFIVWPKLGKRQNRSAAVPDVIESLSAQYDQLVLFCPPPEQGTAVTQKAVNCASAVVVLAQSGHTTRSASEKIRALLSHNAATPAGLMVA
jgi:uncharacterized protein involved in exopolysaccharide biosynthesis